MVYKKYFFKNIKLMMSILQCIFKEEYKKIEFLVENGADINEKNIYGDTLLHFAVLKSNNNLAKLLLKHGANVNGKNNNGTTPLHSSLDVSTSKLLLKSGGNVNEKNGNGCTPLHYAADICHIDLIKLLLEYGADHTIKDNKGNGCFDNLPINIKNQLIDQYCSLDIKEPGTYY